MILFEINKVSLAKRALSIVLVSEIFTLLFTVPISACACAFEYLVSSAACVNVLIGLSISLVLSTLPKPTFDALIPLAIFKSVTAPLAIFEVTMAPLATRGKAAVPDKSPASFNIPLLVASASVTFVFELFELPPPFPDATIEEST